MKPCNPKPPAAIKTAPANKNRVNAAGRLNRAKALERAMAKDVVTR